MKKIILLFLVLFGAITAVPVFASGELVKSSSSPVIYYLDGKNIRHPFPTEKTYKTWYGSFDNVRILNPDQMRKYPLGKNITVRPGVNLVTFPTDPDFYAVEIGGVIRPFEDWEIAEDIYGPDWQKRVVTVPDAFFNDYALGEEIEGYYQLPDGFLFQTKGAKEYYYKYNGLLWPFKDEKSVLANKFDLADAAASALSLNKRKKEIIGLDPKVFDPAAAPLRSNADCQNKKFKIAFVLIAQDRYTIEETEKIDRLKERFEENFKFAAKGLAAADVSFPLTILSNDESLLFSAPDGQKKPDNEAINAFFDKNPDDFDFIVLYNNWVLNEPEVAKYVTLTNDFLGTGNAQMHNAYLFGSRGKLKGIANMGNLSKYSIDDTSSLDQSVNYIIHELLHHFSGRALFKDGDDVSRDLLLAPNYNHYNMYVDFISPLGGNGWQDNGDGAFTSKITVIDNPNRKAMSDLDLYFMGLLPKVAVDPVKYLVPDEPGSAGNVLKGKMREADISQIISAMGDWRCQLE